MSAVCFVVSIYGFIQTAVYEEHIYQLSNSYQNYCMATVDSSFIFEPTETRSGQKSVYNFVRVSYTIDDIQYTNVNAGITSLKVNRGDELLIHYDPLNPSDCTAAFSNYAEFCNRLYSFILVFGIIVISIMILPIIVLKIREHKNIKYLSPVIKNENKQSFYYTDYNQDDNKSV